MAKSAKKKTAKAKVPAGPLAILYNLDAGTERGDKVRAILAELGIRPKTVTVAKLGDSVGSLAGLTGMKPARTEYEGEVPGCEFMLLNAVPPSLLNQLLAAMRAADVVVGCKAQVTQYNRLWPFATLVREVSAEHAAMTGGAAPQADPAEEGEAPQADPTEVGEAPQAGPTKVGEAPQADPTEVGEATNFL